MNFILFILIKKKRKKKAMMMMMMIIIITIAYCYVSLSMLFCISRPMSEKGFKLKKIKMCSLLN